MEKLGGLLFSGNKKVPNFLPRLPDEPPGRPLLRTGIGRSDALVTLRGRLAPGLGIREEAEAAGDLLWVNKGVIDP
jgi:hypothetical protein